MQDNVPGTENTIITKAYIVLTLPNLLSCEGLGKSQMEVRCSVITGTIGGHRRVQGRLLSRKGIYA